MPANPEAIVTLSESQAQNLIKLYTQAEQDITKKIERALERNNDIVYLSGMKRNIDIILEDLKDGGRKWVDKVVPMFYKQGAEYANRYVKEAGATVIPGPWLGAIHQHAMQVLAEATYGRIDNISNTIGRQVDDIYRNLQLEAIRGTVAGYDTWQQTARNLRRQFEEQGITGFTDKRGRKWNMTTYTEMVARTATMEAHLGGTGNRLLEHGFDLIEISVHTNPCKYCEPWQGKVLSLTGKTKGYPTLAEARKAKLFHPNCRHAYSIALSLEDEISKLEKELGGDSIKPTTVKQITLVDTPISSVGGKFGDYQGHAKTREFIEEAVNLAEKKGADFTGISIESSSYFDTHKPYNGFIMPNDLSIIHLCGTDVAKEASRTAESLKNLYEYLDLDPALANRADSAVECTARTLLHERGHIETFKVNGNYVAQGFDDRFSDYIDDIEFARPDGLSGIENYDIGEWIAEDYRLVIDPESPFPHKFGYRFDLQYPDQANARRAKLKEALGL